MKKLPVIASIACLVLATGWEGLARTHQNPTNLNASQLVWETAIVDGGQPTFNQQLIDFEANGYEPFSTSSYTKGNSSSFYIFLKKQITFAQLEAPVIQAAQQQAQLAQFAGTWQIVWQIKTNLPSTVTITVQGMVASVRLGLISVGLDVIDNPDGTFALNVSGLRMTVVNGIMTIVNLQTNTVAGTGRKVG